MGYGKGQEEFNRTMERVVSLKKGRESYEGMEGVRENWKGPGRVREDRNN